MNIYIQSFVCVRLLIKCKCVCVSVYMQCMRNDIFSNFEILYINTHILRVKLELPTDPIFTYMI